ncbi:uncharacterized protein STEHIDRAFT_116476 [Stereum hirsutum FP-91666 SS1]|uniref:Uncharacterized protein n=1 Tax=Stereum hirsutum (strain FP-91666) TaxID=721885 RepID=R7RXS3_STEHR|nr:uncharacterized protein STEHIDRAFT_116476 [Stereum hirsutum FP-91666 SS1]EIM79588.1 hypothetical protein STEHIDRAFT_116476 [Stereum hirsutum FP-91666 SS1]
MSHRDGRDGIQSIDGMIEYSVSLFEPGDTRNCQPTLALAATRRSLLQNPRRTTPSTFQRKTSAKRLGLKGRGTRELEVILGVGNHEYGKSKDTVTEEQRFQEGYSGGHAIAFGVGFLTVRVTVTFIMYRMRQNVVDFSENGSRDNLQELAKEERACIVNATETRIWSCMKTTPLETNLEIRR